MGQQATAVGNPSTSRTTEALRYVLVLVAFGVITKLGLLFVAPPENVSYFWPAGGFVLALLTLAPPARWRSLMLVIYAAGVVLNAWGTGRGIVPSLGFALGDVLEAWPAAWILARFGSRRADFGSVRQVLALVLGAAPTSAVLSALVGASIVTRLGTTGSFVDAFRSWAVSVLVSVLVVTPLIVTWGRGATRMSRGELAETGVLVGLLGVVTYFVFGATSPGLPLLYLPFPLVFLASVRLGPRGASLASFVVTVVAVSLAVRGLTPFTGSSTAMRAHEMQLLIVTMSVSALAMAAAIVEQQGTAARLRQAEERYRAVVESAPVGLVLVASDGVIAFANPAFLAIVGRSASDVIGRSFAELTHPDDRGPSLDMLDALVRGKRDRFSLEKRYLRPDGTVAETRIDVGVLRDEVGQVQTFAMIEDVTERKRLEGQLLQSQKLDAVGRLAGGVAHDFNNLLTIILAQATLGARSTADGRVTAAFTDITDAARRGAGLTRQLLAFSRKQVIEPKIVDLAVLVGDVVHLLGRLLGEHVEIRYECRPGAGPVRIDPSQVEQIVINLAVNARDAMPDGGTLTITVEPGSLHASDDAGDGVLLTLTDTGVGMDEDVQKHLFEPFFTTKERGKGTGLGLATVHAAVSQAGGQIDVSSTLGVGTTFRVWLPSAQMPPDPKSVARIGVAGQGETVLVVEDEPAVRRVAVEVLRESGYEVLEAEGADAALALAREYRGSIDLLLTDVIMPGKNGRALADELRVVRPRVLVLFTSGYTDDLIARHGVLDEVTSFLQKPYTADDLLAKVQRLLHG